MKKPQKRIVDFLHRTEKIWLLIGIFLVVLLALQVYNRLDNDLRLYNDVQVNHVPDLKVYKLGEETLQLTNIHFREAEGTSMFPTYATGNTLLLRPYNISTELYEGQIVVFNLNNELVGHRITYSSYPDFVITSGDNSYETQKIECDKIEYIVVGILYT